MQRPYVICHMLQSIDGKISGQFFGDPKTLELAGAYQELGRQLAGDGILYGSITAKELFETSGKMPKTNDEVFDHQDHIEATCDFSWIVILDLDGSIQWNQKSLYNSRLQNKNIVVIVSDQLPSLYYARLRALHISYLLVHEHIDLHEIMQRLYQKCGIHKLILQGGGIINGSLMNEHLIDEISLFISSQVSLEKHAATCFTFTGEHPSLVSFQLKEAKMIASGIWLHYIRNEN